MAKSDPTSPKACLAELKKYKNRLVEVQRDQGTLWGRVRFLLEFFSGHLGRWFGSLVLVTVLAVAILMGVQTYRQDGFQTLLAPVELALTAQPSPGPVPVPVPVPAPQPPRRPAPPVPKPRRRVTPPPVPKPRRRVTPPPARSRRTPRGIQALQIGADDDSSEDEDEDEDEEEGDSSEDEDSSEA